MAFQKPLPICPICKEGKQFRFVQDFDAYDKKYSLYQCLLCQVQFWLPINTTKNDWYEENNYYRIRDLGKTKISREYHKYFLKKYKLFPKNTKILDLGCGSGEFIAELEKKRCDVWGVDFDKEVSMRQPSS